MKVAIVINDLMIRGGTHKQVLRLCEYLESQNIDFILLTKDYDPKKTYPDFSKFSIRVLDRNKEKIPISSQENKVEGLIRKYKEDKALLKLIPDDVDVVNIHDNGTVWLMLWSKTKKKAKVVWQSNDLPVCFRVWDSPTVQKSLYCRALRILYRRIIKKVDQITVNVTKNQERVVRYVGSDAKVFYCGVDYNGGLERHHFQRNKTVCNILSAGVFFERRNYITLVDVVAYLKLKNVCVHLDIIGSTELDKNYADKVKKHVNALGLENDVTIWGQVNEKKYNELYNNADIFSFININQSWGLAIFEAMSCGLPVIVSNSVGAIELLTDKKDAIIVDPLNVEEISSEIIKLMSDEKYYEFLSQNGFDAVKTYTWDNLYSSKMLNLFRELVGETK